MEKQRLIDANALKQELERRQSWQSEKTASRFKEGFDCGLEAALEDIVAAPTAPALVLPCAVGDTVYKTSLGNISEYTVTGFAGGAFIEIVYLEFTANGKTYACSSDLNSEKLYFKKEEAEAALRRAENG